MNKLKIAVDLDGVVWDIMRVFIDIYNRLYKENVKYEDVDQWSFFPEDRWEVVYPLTLPRIMEYPIIDKYIPTYLYYMNKVCDVTIVTKEQNPIRTMEAKLRTLDIVKGREYDKIIKLPVNGNKLIYPFNVYIDDYPGMAKKMNEYPEKLLLFYDQPWNRKDKYIGVGNVIRVNEWKDVLSFIRTLLIIREFNDTLFR